MSILLHGRPMSAVYVSLYSHCGTKRYKYALLLQVLIDNCVEGVTLT